LAGKPGAAARPLENYLRAYLPIYAASFGRLSFLTTKLLQTRSGK
jgi:hypothetical protein